MYVGGGKFMVPVLSTLTAGESASTTSPLGRIAPGASPAVNCVSTPLIMTEGIVGPIVQVLLLGLKKAVSPVVPVKRARPSGSNSAGPNSYPCSGDVSSGSMLPSALVLTS